MAAAEEEEEEPILERWAAPSARPRPDAARDQDATGPAAPSDWRAGDPSSRGGDGGGGVSGGGAGLQLMTSMTLMQHSATRRQRESEPHPTTSVTLLLQNKQRVMKTNVFRQSRPTNGKQRTFPADNKVSSSLGGT